MKPEDEVPSSPFNAPDITPASQPKTAAQRLRETPNIGTEAANAGAQVHPAASSVPVPQPSDNPPMPGAADTGKGIARRIDPPATTERNDLTSLNAPGVIPTERQPEPHDAHVRHGRLPHMNTAASDAAFIASFPQLGDTIRVSVDAVPYMERRARHNALINAGLNGVLGTVIGQEVQGDTLYLRIETPSHNVLVPVECCLRENPVINATPDMQPSSRISPEKMRKPSDGSYNKT
jgi:hypothetical protein